MPPTSHQHTSPSPSTVSSPALSAHRCVASGKVETVAATSAGGWSVLRVGSHVAEAPQPSPGGAGGTAEAPAGGPSGGYMGKVGTYSEGVVRYKGPKNPMTYKGFPYKKKLTKGAYKYGYAYPEGLRKRTYRRPDPQGDALISNKTFMSRLVGNVGCCKGKPGSVWTKHFNDLLGLDGTTIGFSHFARDSVIKLFLTLSAACPEEMAAAFGEDGAAKLNNGAWIRKNDPWLDDAGIYRFDWLQKGWLKIARQPFWSQSKR